MLLLVACADSPVSGPSTPPPGQARTAIVTLDCTATVAQPAVVCQPSPVGGGAGASRDIVGGQDTFVTLAASNFSYGAVTHLYQFDVTVQNLLNEAMGTPDGTVVDTAGVRVFFLQQPTVTGSTGPGAAVTILNSDGAATFTAASQPYYKYAGILAKDSTSAPKTWQFDVSPEVTTFGFKVYISTTVQPMLVINEVLPNPGGIIRDANGEWFEVYNAGTLPVDMQGYAIKDSLTGGTQKPFHVIASSLIVPPAGYVVLGNTMDTTNNGGVPVDYAYGAALQFTNSTGALRISRLFDSGGASPDTLTIDYVKYVAAGISALNGISRELINPAFDNLDIDGANWAHAAVSAVYGPGGRGTPKAQNSTYVP